MKKCFVYLQYKAWSQLALLSGLCTLNSMFLVYWNYNYKFNLFVVVFPRTLYHDSRHMSPCLIPASRSTPHWQPGNVEKGLNNYFINWHSTVSTTWIIISYLNFAHSKKLFLFSENIKIYFFLPYFSYDILQINMYVNWRVGWGNFKHVVQFLKLSKGRRLN